MPRLKGSLIDALTSLVTTVAGTPWAYVVIAVVLLIDGFFPFVPGETLVVALSALAAAHSGPQWYLVLVVSVVATVSGDAIAFFLGKTLGITRWRWMRQKRIAAGFAWAARGLRRRPATFFLTAKFVPVGRVAVTMTAGATGFVYRRYLPISILASTVYTAYHVVIGYTAGTWFAENPLLAVVASIAVVLAVGMIVDGVATAKERARVRTAGPAC